MAQREQPATQRSFAFTVSIRRVAEAKPAGRRHQVHQARTRIEAHDPAGIREAQHEIGVISVGCSSELFVEAADGAPLWPQGFDPLNVTRIDGQRVLHTRFVKLGNDAGHVEVIGHASLSEGAGTHPLFNGLKRLQLTGLAKPVVQESGGSVSMKAEGLDLQFKKASIATSGETIRIVLLP